ncbi:unnamed protein product [Allacma fusca]|uniref:Uncharacterized protein n=1 Tax=Allacma fusca TaxID=39272 RepID=A0A8J2P1J6_9HEXA|nr:unnamed protein product [Allacma fusca]
MILEYFLAILLTFSLFATNQRVWAQSFNQSITLYRGYDCKGQKFEIGTKVSTMFDWNDAAYSVAITGA